MSNVKTKAVVTLVIKIVALTFALLIIQAVASQVAGLNASSQQVDPAIAGQYALLTSFSRCPSLNGHGSWHYWP